MNVKSIITRNYEENRRFWLEKNKANFAIPQKHEVLFNSAAKYAGPGNDEHKAAFNLQIETVFHPLQGRCLLILPDNVSFAIITSSLT